MQCEVNSNDLAHADFNAGLYNFLEAFLFRCYGISSNAQQLGRKTASVIRRDFDGLVCCKIGNGDDRASHAGSNGVRDRSNDAAAVQLGCDGQHGKQRNKEKCAEKHKETILAEHWSLQAFVDSPALRH